MTALVNIRQCRLNKGWTLATAAERFEITEGALSMIERNLRVPGPEVAFRIASTYGYTPAQVWPVKFPEQAA